MSRLWTPWKVEVLIKLYPDRTAKAIDMKDTTCLQLATELGFKSPTDFTKHLGCTVSILQQPSHVAMQGRLIQTYFARGTKCLYPRVHRGHGSKCDGEGDSTFATDEYREPVQVFGRKSWHRGMQKGFRQHITMMNAEFLEIMITEGYTHSPEGGSRHVAQHHKLSSLQQCLRLTPAPFRNDWYEAKRQGDNCSTACNDGTYRRPEIPLVTRQYPTQRYALRGKPRSHSTHPFAQAHLRPPEFAIGTKNRTSPPTVASLGAFDTVIDRDVAIQFARLVIEAYDRIREADAC